MAKFDRVEKIFDFAISRETDAHKFYKKLAKRTGDVQLIETLKGLAEEELSHKAKLQAVRKGEALMYREEGIDLCVDDCSVQVPPGRLLDRDAIIDLGLKKEAEAIRLYKALAATLDWGGLREVFLLLAQEETKHKARFQSERKPE